MAKTTALVFGVIYTLIGILGFIPALGGSASSTASTLLGIAPVNVLHNVVHLIIGVPGLLVAGNEANSKAWAKIFGVVLLVVGVVGFFLPSFFGLLPIGGGDIAIHLITGVILAYVGFSSTVATRPAT